MNIDTCCVMSRVANVTPKISPRYLLRSPVSIRSAIQFMELSPFVRITRRGNGTMRISPRGPRYRLPITGQQPQSARAWIAQQTVELAHAHEFLFGEQVVAVASCRVPRVPSFHPHGIQCCDTWLCPPAAY